MILVFWSLLANIIIIGIEYAYRHVFDNWFEGLPYLILPILVAQFALFKLFHTSSSWLLAAATFSIVTAIMRIVPVYYSGEVLTSKILLGVVFVTLGTMLISQKI